MIIRQLTGALPTGRVFTIDSPLAADTGSRVASSIEAGKLGFRDMRFEGTKLLAAENELKLLMADVTRAMEKAQDAVARIAHKAAAATTEAQPAPAANQGA